TMTKEKTKRLKTRCDANHRPTNDSAARAASMVRSVVCRGIGQFRRKELCPSYALDAGDSNSGIRSEDDRPALPAGAGLRVDAVGTAICNSGRDGTSTGESRHAGAQQRCKPPNESRRAAARPRNQPGPSRRPRTAEETNWKPRLHCD